MAPRPSDRSAVLTSFLIVLTTALPSVAQKATYEPVRLMPTWALTAPMVGTRPISLTAPTIRATLTPSLQAPALTTTLSPRVQAAHLVGSLVIAPVAPGPAAPAASIIETGITVQQALSQRNAQDSQVLSSFYEGIRRCAPAVDLSPVKAPAASGSDYLAKTQGLSGSQLLTSLHQITGRDYHAHEYKDASQYMFSVADNIVSHGVRGVVDAYSGIFVPGTSSNGGDYSDGGDQDGDGYPERDGMNVEHTWPQSFFDKVLPMRSDLHHLLPTFQHPNSMRSNLPFGEVTGQPDYSNAGGAKEGGGVFEPPDASKGRVARAILYFYTRYYDQNITQGAYNHGFFKDRIDMFLRWNREHPPTTDELRRNDLVEQFQNNRNPYVDDPSLADLVGVGSFNDNFRRFPSSARLSPLDFTLH